MQVALAAAVLAPTSSLLKIDENYSYDDSVDFLTVAPFRYACKRTGPGGRGEDSQHVRATCQPPSRHPRYYADAFHVTQSRRRTIMDINQVDLVEQPKTDDDVMRNDEISVRLGFCSITQEFFEYIPGTGNRCPLCNIEPLPPS